MSFTLEDINIRTKLQPGDLGYIVHRHGKLYAKEYGYGIVFESYVAAGIHEFYQAYDPARDRVWICEHRREHCRFSSPDASIRSVAQLRFFYLEPPYRGVGLGKKLITLYMEFLKNVGTLPHTYGRPMNKQPLHPFISERFYLDGRKRLTTRLASPCGSNVMN